MLQDGVGGYTGATALELLRLFASYAAHPLDPARAARAGRPGRASRGTPVKRLSGGQQQRLSLAMALVGRPELLFLDEPTTGMDPQARRGTWELIRRLRPDGVCVVLTTHYLDEAEELADPSWCSTPAGSSPRAARPSSPGPARQASPVLRAPPGLPARRAAAALPAGRAASSEPPPGRTWSGPR